MGNFEKNKKGAAPWPVSAPIKNSHSGSVILTDWKQESNSRGGV